MGVDHRTMRELMLDAAEAVWWLATAPWRKIVADAMQEVLERNDTKAVLKWSDNDDDEPELPLRMPDRRRLIDRLRLHL